MAQNKGPSRQPQVLEIGPGELKWSAEGASPAVESTIPPVSAEEIQTAINIAERVKRDQRELAAALAPLARDLAELSTLPATVKQSRKPRSRSAPQQKHARELLNACWPPDGVPPDNVLRDEKQLMKDLGKKYEERHTKRLGSSKDRPMPEITTIKRALGLRT